MPIKKNVSESEAEKEVLSESKPMYEGINSFAYIGPSLPGGRLSANTILSGTYAEITDYFKEAIAEYPGIEKLFVPVTRLAESHQKLSMSGSLISKYYKDAAAVIKAKGDKK